MIKKRHIRDTISLIILITNVIFWSYVYLDIKLKAQRFVFQVTESVITDKRVNKGKNQYLYADTSITFSNLLTRNKVSAIYGKDFSKAKPFKRYICPTGENTLEYSRQDENILNNEDATLMYRVSIEIPVMAIIKTYFEKNQMVMVDTNVNELPLKITVDYLTYKHVCGTFPDWHVQI